jgi:hypothetical protein
VARPPTHYVTDIVFDSLTMSLCGTFRFPFAGVLIKARQLTGQAHYEQTGDQNVLCCQIPVVT